MYPIETQDGLFHDGDGVSELGTIVPAWWLNQMQAELAAILTAAGITPTKADQAQVLAAIRALISGQNLPVGGTYSAKKFYAPGTLIFIEGNWYEAYHPDGCLGKDPRDPTNRPEAWGNTDVSQPYYWIKIGPWLELPPVGSPIYLPSTNLTEGLIKYRGDGLLHKDKFWRLAHRHSSLVSGDYVKISELRAEFLRGLDDGRGIDLNRVINTLQLDAMQNHGHSSMRLRKSSATGTSYSSPDGSADFTADSSLIGPISVTAFAGGVPRVSGETRGRNIAMLAATRI